MKKNLYIFFLILLLSCKECSKCTEFKPSVEKESSSSGSGTGNNSDSESKAEESSSSGSETENSNDSEEDAEASMQALIEAKKAELGRDLTKEEILALFDPNLVAQIKAEMATAQA